MELQLGRMTGKQLAAWFGISEGAFKNNKVKKLKELENFAEFYESGGKVYITKIFESVYSKKGSKAYQMIRDKVDEVWSNNGLDTCSRVSQEISEIYGASLPLAQSSVYNYTLKGRNELYGKPFVFSGKIGECQYLWCKREGEGATTKYLPFTEEELEIKKSLLKKYFGDTTEKQLFVDEMVKSGEISKEDAWSVLTDLTNMTDINYRAFLSELEARIGFKVTKATKVIRNIESFAEEENLLLLG